MSDSDVIFTPDPGRASRSRLLEFIRFCEGETGAHLPDFASLHEFSIQRDREFWALLLRWSRLDFEGSLDPVRVGDDVEHARFFPELRLSYTEALLEPRSDVHDDALAIIACHADRPPERLTRAELRNRVARVAAGLQQLGLNAGDRVVAYSRNNAETAIAALATVGLGATLSTAAPDMGAFAVLSRYAQLEPAFLLTETQDSSVDGGEGLRRRVSEIVSSLPGLRGIIVLDQGAAPAFGNIPTHRLADLAESAPLAVWPRFPFNHPLFILFSSGTTGKPKAIIHGMGGALLEHVKEHRLHCDLRPGEMLMFQTSCAWMMWQWQLSALASGAGLVLYDGALAGARTLWDLVDAEKVNVFGTSPAYLQFCEDEGYAPREQGPWPHLRAVLSTGSVLRDRQYDWVHANVGPVALQSISGGTDMLGCFVLGCPILPVRRGEIQCRSLGLDVRAMPDASGGPVGELVCANPFPSRPLGFVDDVDGGRFHRAYFAQNPGVWTHGDLIEFTPHGGARIHGRSDGILNVRGIRIGPAEITRILDDVPEVAESMVVAQEDESEARHHRQAHAGEAPPKVSKPACRRFGKKFSASRRSVSMTIFSISAAIP